MFGNTAAAPSGGFSFGGAASTNNASAPKASFSFGMPAANTSTPGAAAPAGGSTFGLAGAQNTGTPGQASAAGGSLFGNNTTQQQPQQQSAGGGLFGSTPAASGSLFGQSTQTPGQGTGMFGQNTQAQGQASTSGTSLFGQQNTQNQAGQTGGLFGNNQQAKPLFGSTSTAPTNTFGQPSQPSTSLFGSTQNNAQPSTSLFGSTAQPAQGTSLFGSTAPAQQPAGASLFGSFGAAKPAGTQPGGLFGSTTQPAASTSGAFGFGGLAQSQQPQQQGAFGFGSTTTNQNQQQQMQSQMQAPSQLQISILGQSSFKKDLPIQQRLEAIQAGWNVCHPDCRFKAFFYNLVEPHEVSRYSQPQNVSPELWAKAERENPDRSCLVPVLATGWSDVEKRLKAQREMANAEQRQIQELSKTLANIERQKTVQATLKLVALQTRLAQLQHRLVHLAVNTGLAAQAGSSSSSSSGTRVREQELRTALDGVKSELDGTAPRAKTSHGGAHLYGSGSASPRSGTPRKNAAGQKMMGQVNELWGAVEELRRRKGYAVKEREAWVDDERIMGEIAKVLTEQQMALQKLNTVLEDSKFDAKVIGDTLTRLGLP